LYFIITRAVVLIKSEVNYEIIRAVYLEKKLKKWKRLLDKHYVKV